MKIDYERYGCKECSFMQCDYFEWLYKNSIHCQDCKLKYEARQLNEALKLNNIYDFMTRILDGLTWILSKFGRK